MTLYDRDLNVLWRGRVVPGEKGRFKLPAISLPEGRTAVYAVASNAWGTKWSDGFGLYNLGSEVPSFNDFLLVDRDVCDMYYVRGRVVKRIYPVAVGMPGLLTPLGQFYLSRPGPAPNSAWGPFRMALMRKTSSGRYRGSGFYMHGTNAPSSIGTWASHGCVRMYNGDVIGLARQIYYAFPVYIRR